mgnify:CR=1 FL=1
MKAYFGDNQFIGVNHSEGKGLDYLSKYESVEDIAITLRDAWDAGIRDFCFTVNKKTIDAINLVISDCPFNLHPALPYAHRVNELLLEKGLIGTLTQKVGQFGVLNLIRAGGTGLFGKYDNIFHLLVRSELEGIPMEYVKSVGLLNVAADFVLGLNRADLLHSFYRVVKDRLGCKPMFYTMNFPLMAESLWGSGYTDCGLIFNYNKNGFRTNPSISEVQKCISKYSDRETIAMSLFSGGKESELKEVLSTVPSLSGVLFGSSKKVNIENNIKALEQTTT